MTSSASYASSISSTQVSETKKIKTKSKETSKEDVSGINSDGRDSEAENDSEQEAPGVEEPLLSHKERRKRKKEDKLAERLAKEDGSASKKQKLQNGSAKAVDSAPTKRQNSVWVGNMSFKTTQDQLKNFFKFAGEITRINMPTKAHPGPGNSPENRGFAYVDFATPEGKAAAIALSEQPLIGRKLLIKDGGDFTGRPAAVTGEEAITDPSLVHKTHSKTAQKILRVQKQPPAPTLFFGNLGFETTVDSIHQLLDAHRTKPKLTKGKDTETEDLDADKEEQKPKDWIRKIRMGTFEDSGLCKGFAFVDFMTIEDATSALINPKNHRLDGRNLVVEYASADAVRRGAPKGNKPIHGPGGKRAEGRGRGGKVASIQKSERLTKSFDTSREKNEEATSEKLAKVEFSQEPSKDKNRDKSGLRHKGPKSRPKPGAALALAKRESVAIVPNQGRKVTF